MHRLSLIVAVLLVSAAGLTGCGDTSSDAAPAVTVTVAATPYSEEPTAPTTAPPTELSPTPVSTATLTTSPFPTATATFATDPPTLPPTEPTQPTQDQSPPVDTSVPPRTYDAAVAHFDAVGSEPVAAKRFVTPSGNIYCSLDDTDVPAGCELRTGEIKDPAYCRQAPTPYIGRVEIFHGQVQAICNTDTIMVPGARTLAYGVAARMRGGDVLCLSEKIGVTCIDPKATAGFFLRKGSTSPSTRAELPRRLSCLAGRTSLWKRTDVEHGSVLDWCDATHHRSSRPR